MAADLEVSIGVDVDQLNNGLNSASKKFEEFGKKMTSIGSAMSLAITTPLLLIGKQMITLASDSEESLNKVEVAFGNASEYVKEFANNSLEKFGVARGSALDMAAGFGDIATSMGLTQEQASKMSVSLVGLGADLASFKNIGIDQAKSALTGIFTGETESLKMLGIVMTEANLQAYALTKGFKGKLDTLTQGEKVLLRYNYVLDKTKNAQGDFERTGGGAANQMRIFQESLKEVGSTFGDVLLPYFTKAITYINNLLKAFKGLDEGTKKAILAMAGITLVIAPIMLVIGQVIALTGYLKYLVTPVGLFAVAMAASAIYVIKEWDKVREFFHDLEVSFFKFKTNLGAGLFAMGLIDAQTAFGDFAEGFSKISRFSEKNTKGVKDFLNAVKNGFKNVNNLLDFTGKTSGEVDTGGAEKQIKDAGYKRLEAFKKMHSDEMRERDKQFSERLKKEREYALEMEKILSLEDLPAVNPISLNFSEEQSLNITGLKSDLGQEIGGLSDFLLNNWNNLRSRFSELNLPEFPSNQKIFEKLKIDWTDGIDDVESEMIEKFLKMRDVLKGVMDIVSNSLGDTFSGIFESMFSKDVKFDFKKVLSSFMRSLGQFAISLGSAILAVGLGLSASAVGVAVAGKEVAAGLGLIALGGALMGGGSAIGKTNSSSVNTSTGARNIVPTINPSGFNNTVKFEIQGNTLVGVLNNVNRANG